MRDQLPALRVIQAARAGTQIDSNRIVTCPACGAHVDRCEPASESAVHVTVASALTIHAAQPSGISESSTASSRSVFGANQPRWPSQPRSAVSAVARSTTNGIRSCAVSSGSSGCSTCMVAEQNPQRGAWTVGSNATAALQSLQRRICTRTWLGAG